MYDLSAPATVYCSINSNPKSERYGWKYVGFDSKEVNSTYVGSSTTKMFNADKRHLFKNEVFRGTVEQCLVMEQKILQLVNAQAKSAKYYNETNSNGYDADFELNFESVTNDQIDKVLEDVELMKPVESVTTDLDEKLLMAAIAKYEDDNNTVRNSRAVLKAMLDRGQNMQVRQTLINQSRVDHIADLMNDEIDKDLCPATEAKPIAVVDDTIANGHHTLMALHKIGYRFARVVKFDLEDDFGGDWNLVQIFGERVNKPKHVVAGMNHADCVRSVNREINRWFDKLGLEDDDKAKLASLKEDNSMKSHIKETLKVSGYTTNQIEHAFKKLEQNWVNIKKLGGRTQIPVSECERVIGKNRSELMSELREKYKAVTSKGILRYGDVPSAVAAAVAPLAEGRAETVILVLNHAEDEAHLDDERDRVLQRLKSNVMFGREAGSVNLRVVVIPCFEGDELLDIHIDDI